MRSFLLTTTLGLLATTSYAQTVIKAGTVQLGGNVGYSQSSSNTPSPYYNGSGYINATQHVSGKNYSINPMVGYFIADNLSVGISLLHSIGTTTYSYDTAYLNGSEQRNTQLNLGAFIQYYRMFTEHFGVVGTLSAGYDHSTFKTTSANNNTGNTSNGFSTLLTPSLIFFPIPKFSVGTSIGSLGYSHSTNKPDDANGAPSIGTSDGSSFGTNFGLAYLAFSGTYYFGR